MDFGSARVVTNRAFFWFFNFEFIFVTYPAKNSFCVISGVFNMFSENQSAQKQAATYAKFACLDGCHLTEKFKGMLICATNQDSN